MWRIYFLSPRIQHVVTSSRTEQVVLMILLKDSETTHTLTDNYINIFFISLTYSKESFIVMQVKINTFVIGEKKKTTTWPDNWTFPLLRVFQELKNESQNKKSPASVSALHSAPTSVWHEPWLVGGGRGLRGTEDERGETLLRWRYINWIRRQPYDEGCYNLSF